MHTDESKVKAIVGCSEPTNVTELGSLLGLYNLYREFIHGYNHVVSYLVDLLRQDMSWVWTNECKIAFDTLKATISLESILNNHLR